MLLNTNNTGRHQFPLWRNFDRFSMGRGLQTVMCVQNVYITHRLEDTS
jgi:hypothetical protein